MGSAGNKDSIEQSEQMVNWLLDKVRNVELCCMVSNYKPDFSIYNFRLNKNP